ncbi:mucoidy inhibitor MuiA family protein [bacterium]|nr:mucoidy inhibitor MuiA family protein [bacterium]
MEFGMLCHLWRISKLKNMKFIIAFVACFATLGLYAETIDLASKISGVTVYPSGATISRTASTQITKGNKTLRFYGISNSIDPNSIQLEAKGDYIVQSIAYRYDYLKPIEESKEVKKLQDSLQWLADKKDLMTAEKYAYEQELSFIISNKTVGNQQQLSQSEEFDKLAEIIRKRILEIKRILFDYGIKERKINARYYAIQAQINEIRGNSPQPQGIIEVQLLAEENISGSFKITYMVRNAGWRPVYDLKFNELDQPIAAKYNAYVHQSTGVEWTNVNLLLSTTNPSQDNTKPQLHPWQLYYKEPIQYTTRNVAIMEAYEYKEEADGTSITDSARMPDNKPAMNAAEFTAIMESVLAMDFEVNLPYTIGSDGKERVINLRKIEIPATYTYYAAPKLVQEAFLVANLTDWVNMQLLPGEANIFMGDSYMGKSYLNPGIGSDTIAVAFGRDKMVQINRQLLSRECKKSRIAGKQRHNLSFEITVRNLHKTEITLVIDDQIPISSIEEIEVELNEKSGADYIAKTGLLTWELKIKPGATEQKKFSFEVRHPRNKVVYPLNYL